MSAEIQVTRADRPPCPVEESETEDDKALQKRTGHRMETCAGGTMIIFVCQPNHDPHEPERARFAAEAMKKAAGKPLNGEAGRRPFDPQRSTCLVPGSAVSGAEPDTDSAASLASVLSTRSLCPGSPAERRFASL